MSQLDPTGIDNASEDAIGDTGVMTYEEVSGLSNGELGIGEPHEAGPTGAVPGLAGQPAVPLAQQPPLPIPTIPIPPIPGIKKAVSGCYAGLLGGFQVDLRVDVDRNRPMRRVSGDFYQTVGRTTSYFGSFVVDSPAVTVSATRIVVKGMGRYTFAAGAPVVQVTIPRVNIFQPQAAATLQFFTLTNAPGASYHCPFSSLHFRTVRVRYPVSADENVLADLFMGEDQGALLYLQGSDNDTLRSGNAAFDEVLDRFDAHPMAAYVRMVKGINAGRAFKTVNAGDGKPLAVRPAHPDESVALLSRATEAQVLDPVSQGEVLTCLAAIQGEPVAVNGKRGKR